MRTLKIGMSGPDVEQWQIFLIGRGFNVGRVDGEFGIRTSNATKKFQIKSGLLGVDGIVGERTVAKAGRLGFEVEREVVLTRGKVKPVDVLVSSLVPPTPATRQAMFGYLRYQASPVSGNLERIEILNDWPTRNLRTIKLHELAGKTHAPVGGAVTFHEKGIERLIDLWKAWDEAALLDRVLTWDGSYNPRFIRGSRTVLSPHAYGAAFDINAIYNPLGAIPAHNGVKGCVRELVSIAETHGFYWGGHFKNRKDGMHFELAAL